MFNVFFNVFFFSALVFGTFGKRFSATKPQLPSALTSPSREALTTPSTSSSVSPFVLTEIDSMNY